MKKSNLFGTIARMFSKKEEKKEPAQPPAPPSEAKAVTNKSQAVCKRILLVEDNRLNSKVATRQLKTLGYEVDAVVNGQEAVDIMATGTSYGLILMDCQMPVMDGFEATKAIRQTLHIRRDKPIPIIAMTANFTAQDRIQCLEAGMDDFISKPVKMNDLRTLLEKWLG